MKKFKQISSIVCAAGQSVRMGKVNKLLLPFNHQTIIERVIDQILLTKAGEIIVVLGYQYDIIFELLKPYEHKIKIIRNEHFENGQTGSIQRGISMASSESQAFMICLSDMPFLKASHYKSLIDHHFKNRNSTDKVISRPEVLGLKGHPVIMDRYFYADIVNCTDQNGCKSVIQKNYEDLRILKSLDRTFIIDIDTLDTYHRLVKTNS